MQRSILLRGRLTRLSLLLLWTVLLAVVGVLLIGVEISRRYAHTLAYPGCSGPHRTPGEAGISDYQEVTFALTNDTHLSDGMELRGWWVPSKNGAAVVLIPGIGQARDGMLDRGAMLARHGYGVLLTDLRGCVGPNVVFTAGYVEVDDVAEALAFVQTQPGVDSHRIGLLGYSVGGAIAILSAAQLEDIQAVAAEGNFYNLGDDIANSGGNDPLLSRFYQHTILFFYRYYTGVDARLISPIDHIGHISPRSVLLIFGEHEVVSGHAYAQFAAAGEPKSLWIVPSVGHGGYLQAWPEEYEARVVSFFDEALLQ
jgi:pimeloyl-ACP methyl ester carboxylesterase